MAGGMPRPSEAAKAAFVKLVPNDRAVTTRPMFGNLAAFVNGNMFTGLFGEDLFVRLSEEDQARLRKQGGKEFAPMAGRVMKGYLIVPGWQAKSDATRKWIDISLDFSRALPAKGASPKKSRARPSAARAKAKGG
jgi:TfoX/Sxy family transcriptional regulator of competence genes